MTTNSYLIGMIMGLSQKAPHNYTTNDKRLFAFFQDEGTWGGLIEIIKDTTVAAAVRTKAFRLLPLEACELFTPVLIGVAKEAQGTNPFGVILEHFALAHPDIAKEILWEIFIQRNLKGVGGKSQFVLTSLKSIAKRQAAVGLSGPDWQLANKMLSLANVDLWLELSDTLDFSRCSVPSPTSTFSQTLVIQPNTFASVYLGCKNYQLRYKEKILKFKPYVINQDELNRLIGE